MQVKSISDKLTKLHREGEEREAQRKAERLGLKYIDLTTSPTHTDALKLLSEDRAQALKMAPFQLRGRTLSVAVLNPEDEAVRKALQELRDQKYQVVVYGASLSGLKQAWTYYEFVHKPESDISGKVAITMDRLSGLIKKLYNFQQIEKTIISYLDKEEGALSELVEIVLAGGMALGASDIHFEPEDKDVLMRLRVDGLLHDVTHALTHEVYTEIVSRIKILANLKLNVRDEPQDGRFTIALNDTAIEIRVSILPSEYGETTVMRILDPRTIRVGLHELGLREDDLAIMQLQLQKPNGMILNTGPTGSGKTTTLYAFLRTVEKPETKIITLEDPIEYHLEGIEQTQVDPEAGYDFASGIRAIMRQDPDVILVGEIRDKETAITAIQSALTGHLVFSTVHANSSVGAVPRLIDLGARPASIGPALNLVIAQRLVRTFCEECKKPLKMSAQDLKSIQEFLETLPERVNREPYTQPTLFEAKGCKECGGLGYKGRVAVFELLDVGPEMEKLIEQNVGEADIEKFAQERGGLVTMQEDGILKVLRGMTNFDEVARVTGPIRWKARRPLKAMKK